MKEAMKKIVRFAFTPTIVLYVCFMVLTGLLVYVDVDAIGPEGSAVGLSTINKAISDVFGTSLLFYYITEILGWITVCVAIGFFVYGLGQWIDRRKLRRVDKDLICLGFTYFIMLLLDLIFRIFVVNFRPVVVKNLYEISYPCSHVLFAIVVMITAMMQFKSRIKKKSVRRALQSLAFIVLALTIIARLLSGVSWFTDIVGGILLGAALVTFYAGVIRREKNLA